MAIVRAFKAFRPKVGLESKIAALPYDVMNREEAREMVRDNEYSFLHVDRAEVNLPKDNNIYDKAVYEKARDILDKMIQDGLYVQDDNPCKLAAVRQCHILYKESFLRWQVPYLHGLL